MAKQSKDPPNILSTLFSQTLHSSQPPISLFSPNNPFLPKPDQTPDDVEVDQKKRKKGVEDERDSDSVRKSTKEPELIDRSSPNLGESVGVQSKLDDGQNPNLGRSGGGVEVKVKEKKRKRDEIEREYETKKYGGEVVREEEEKMVVVVGKKRKAMDDPEEMKISKEGYDDESKLLRTVFVGNLPLKMKKKGLFRVFSKFGEIESVRLRSVPTLDGKKPKKVQIIGGKINEAVDSVHAYIVFKTEQSAEASLAYMSVVEGNHIRVDRACPPRKKLKEDGTSAPLYNDKRTVFVGNLPFDVKDEELYQLFCGIKQLEDSVEAVRVVRDRGTSLRKGIAYVLFKTREAANFACKKRYLKIRDHELRICHAKSDTQSTPSKRKNPFQDDSENTPYKKYCSGEKTPKSRYQVNTEGEDTSYQGFRASITDENKKFPSRGGGADLRSGVNAKEKVKQRTEKRPSVASRKAMVEAMAGISGGAMSNKAGKKRKMDAITPQSCSRSKKAKRFK